MPYVSRAGKKLAHALKEFSINVRGQTCADFGSSTGGFVDCLLQNEATKVYAVETGYGIVNWRIRNDPRVVIMERTNAMHVILPELVDLLTTDTSWTRIKNVLPNAFKNLKDDGIVIALLKPQYEAKPSMLRKGKLSEEHIPAILESVKREIETLGATIKAITESPIVGEKGGNKEFLLFIQKTRV